MIDPRLLLPAAALFASAVAAAPPTLPLTPRVLPVASPRDAVVDRFDVLYVSTPTQVRRFDLRSLAELPALPLAGAEPTTLDLDRRACRLAIGDEQTASNGLWLLDALAGAPPRRIVLPPPPDSFYASAYGTWSVLWNGDFELLATQRFPGSGWGTLRRVLVEDGRSSVLDYPRQDSMLALAGDGTRFAMVESNISSGPVLLFDARLRSLVAETGTGAFNYEVAVARDGRTVVAINNGFARIYDLTNDVLAARPQSLGDGGSRPVGMVFSPHTAASFATYGGQSLTTPGVYLFADNTLAGAQRIDSLTLGAQTRALNAGRTRLSHDGRWLSVTTPNEVRVYDVAYWGAAPDAIFSDGGECMSPRD